MANSLYTCDPDTDLNCIRPIDGLGGSLYNVPFPVPFYNSSYFYNLSSTSEYTSFKTIDFYLQARSTELVIISIGLAFSVLTIANILILTPPHKRKFLYHILLIGNFAQSIHSSAYIRCWTDGYMLSSYLLLTNDWTSSDWSSGFRASLIIANISICISFACLYITFYTLSHGLLAGLRIKYPIYVYYILIGIMTFISLFAYSWWVVTSVDKIRFIALQQQGDSVPYILQLPWYETLQKGSKITVGLSLGLWSAMFTISALTIIWQRRQALFWSEDHNNGSVFSNKWRARGVYERALQVIAIVALESFIIPLIICVLSFVAQDNNLPNTEELVIPTIYALLPTLSLFNGGSLRTDVAISDTSRPN